MLKRVTPPFRPRTSPGMQQVRVKVWDKVFARFEYLFESKKKTWQPIFGEEPENTLRLPPDQQQFLRSLNLIPPEENDSVSRARLQPG